MIDYARERAEALDGVVADVQFEDMADMYELDATPSNRVPVFWG